MGKISLKEVADQSWDHIMVTMLMGDFLKIPDVPFFIQDVNMNQLYLYL